MRPLGAFEAQWHAGPSTGYSPSLRIQSAPVLVQYVFGVRKQCPAAVGTCSAHPRVVWTRWKMYLVNQVSYDSAGTIYEAPKGGVGCTDTNAHKKLAYGQTERARKAAAAPGFCDLRGPKKQKGSGLTLNHAQHRSQYPSKVHR